MICVTVVPPAVRLLATVTVVPPCTPVTLSTTVEALKVVEDWAAVVELITVVAEFTVCKTVVVETNVETLLDETLDSVVEGAPATYWAVTDD